jgi:hypothetical protein
MLGLFLGCSCSPIGRFGFASAPLAGVEYVSVRILVKETLEKILCEWNKIRSFISVQA